MYWGRANHFRQRESLFVQPSEQVFEVHYAGDRVEIPVGHRIGVEQVVFDDLFDLVVRGVDVQPHQFAAVRHDRPYVAVAEVEYAFHDVLFDFLDLAADGSFLMIALISSSVTLLSPSVLIPSRRSMPEVLFDSSHTNGARFRQYVHRPRHQFGDLFGSLHPDSFRDELPDDQRQVSDDRATISVWAMATACVRSGSIVAITLPKFCASTSPE